LLLSFVIFVFHCNVVVVLLIEIASGYYDITFVRKIIMMGLIITIMLAFSDCALCEVMSMN